MVAVGISHVLQPGRWAELFADLFRRSYAPLVIGTLTLPLGLFVVLTHNVWVLDWPVVVTVCGWGWTVKSVLYLVRPQVGNAVAREGIRKERNFVVAGAVLAGLGLILTWHAFAPVTTA
jgi:hypothetical protein